MFSASCIEGSSLDARGCSAATRGKYIILFKSRSQRALNGTVLLRDGIPNLEMAFYASYGVCFVMVTVRLGYTWLRNAERGLGLGWGCLVSPVRLTHIYIPSVRVIHIYIPSVRLTHIYIPSVRLTHIYIPGVRITHIYILVVRLTHIYISSVRLTHICIPTVRLMVSLRAGSGNSGLRTGL